MSSYIETLNDNQKRAYRWDDGALLVLAGPGSGKTRVLTLRIARILNETSNDYFKILGLTFTNKAAAEMRDRINQLVPDASSRTMLTTFHSFCADVLRQHGSHIGLRPDFTILSQAIDREAHLSEVLNSINTSKSYKPQQILPLIDRLLERCADTTSALSLLCHADPADLTDWISIYDAYRKSLIEKNRLDFPSLIMETYNLFQKNSGVVRHLHRVYQYICVDEFQDTNIGQYEVLKQLVNPEKSNLFVVADDDQIIYQWNGADPKRIESIISDFNMSVIQLPENYRCPPDVIGLANNLIVNNNMRAEGKQCLIARKSKTELQHGVVRLEHLATLEDEARWVSQDILQRTLKERSECAILSRTRKILEVFLEHLRYDGLSGYLSVRKDEFTSYQMQFLHAILRLANSRSDVEQLRTLCKSFYSLEGVYLEPVDIISSASVNNEDYLRSWQKCVLQRGGLCEQTREFVTNGIKGIVDRLDFNDACTNAFSWFEYLISIDHEGSLSDLVYIEEKEVWESLFYEINQEFGKENVVLHLLLQELDMRSKTPVPPVGSIPLLTIHASKGLEFKHVYLVGLVEDQLPSWAAKKKGDDSMEMEEERRNCFVAITRAQETLTLSYSEKVLGWNRYPSRFLNEMGLLD